MYYSKYDKLLEDIEDKPMLNNGEITRNIRNVEEIGDIRDKKNIKKAEEIKYVEYAQNVENVRDNNVVKRDNSMTDKKTQENSNKYHNKVAVYKYQNNDIKTDYENVMSSNYEVINKYYTIIENIVNYNNRVIWK